MKTLSDTLTLRNGVKIPRLGFGTWQIPEGREAEAAVGAALQAGYRHIDTAAAYHNEKSVGKAIRESGLKREEIFVTSKLWNSQRGYLSGLEAFEKSLHDLGLEYLDLYLIHWPANSRNSRDWKRINIESWDALEKAHAEKRVRAIGVSNFLPHHLEALMRPNQVLPMVNQIEFHPGFMQAETVAFCRSKGILIEAWSPLGCGRVLEKPELRRVAEKYGKSTAQLCIRWCLQNEVIAIPKTVSPARMKENAEVFDFEISETDMKSIAESGEFGGSGLNPDEVDF